MKKTLIMLAILINGSCMIQIYAQEKTQISIADVVDFKDSSKEIQDIRQKDKPFTSVEQMPQFPNGQSAMMNYIKENLKYPKISEENGVQGRVIVRFVVSKDGSIKDIQVLRSLEAACDKEAVRIIKTMPKWIPGKQNGKPVEVYYTLPVLFRLEEDIKPKE